MSEELARLIGHRLIARKDVKALQTPDKGYQRRKRGFTMKNMDEHIEGTRSWGHYLLDTDSTTKIFAFDIDVDKEYRHIVTNESDPQFERIWFLLQTMADGLGARSHRITTESGVDCTTVLSYGGGKGLHVIGIFKDPLPASASRSLAEAILGSFNCFELVRGDIFWKHTDHYPELTIEVFPKQTEVSPGSYGNLMRLPLGINAKTGRDAFFVRPGKILTPDDPIYTLREGSFR